MKQKSLLKIYAGNKFLGSNFPILVVVGDSTSDKSHFGEHFLFADFPKLPFIFRRDVVRPGNPRSEYFNFDEYPEIFSAESLLRNQFVTARAHLETTFSNLDMNAYKEVFWGGRAFEFTECNDYALVQFHIYGKYTKEMAAMFKFTRNKQLKDLNKKLSSLPKIIVEEDCGNAKQ